MNVFCKDYVARLCYSFIFKLCRDLKQALQKTKKRVEDQIKKNFGFRKGKKKDGSLEENSGSCKYNTKRYNEREGSRIFLR